MNRKPSGREVMRTYGASVTPSPSETTQVGKRYSSEHPELQGRKPWLKRIEAVEAATTSDGYKYVLGSVLNQVLLHQSVIGEEATPQ